MTRLQERVLRWLASTRGLVRPAELGAGLHVDHARRLLDHLVELGHVTREGDGLYQPTEHGRELGRAIALRARTQEAR